MDSLSITKPDDCHLHVRSAGILKIVIPHTARQFGRAVIMPNLKPPVTSVAQASQYRQEILNALPADTAFQPLMTLYLTSDTQVAEVEKVANSDDVLGFKLYPVGATTHSDSGVSDIAGIFPLLAAMEERAVPLLIHAEVSGAEYDIFDREKNFYRYPSDADYPSISTAAYCSRTLDYYGSGTVCEISPA